MLAYGVSLSESCWRPATHSRIFYCTVLYWLHSTVLYCTGCILLYCTVLAAFYCTVLYCTADFYSLRPLYCTGCTCCEKDLSIYSISLITVLLS